MLYMHCNALMRQRLERLYRKCGRIVLGKSVASDDLSVYSRLKLVPLRLLFQLRGAMFMFRVLQLTIQFRLTIQLQFRVLVRELPLFTAYFVHNRSLSRYPEDLILPKLSVERSRKSVRYWGAKLWNSIPTHIRKAETLAKFTVSYELYLTGKVTDCTDTYDLYDFI